MRVESGYEWKNTAVLSNNNLEVIATLDVGPRIISFRRMNGENILGVAEEQLGHTGEDEFKLRGGHRLWLAPESAATYYPDNHSVDIEEIDADHIRLTAPPEKNIQKSMELQLGEHELRVAHRILALKKITTPVAAWALTILRRGGRALIPQPEPLPHPGHADSTNENAYLPDRHLSLWSYTDIEDDRINWDNPIVIEQRADSEPLKLGFLHRHARVQYEVGLERFSKTVSFQKDALYPDGNCNLEVYTEGDILELETLSPLTTLEQGESIIHEEAWTIVSLA